MKDDAAPGDQRHSHQWMVFGKREQAVTYRHFGGNDVHRSTAEPRNLPHIMSSRCRCCPTDPTSLFNGSSSLVELHCYAEDDL